MTRLMNCVDLHDPENPLLNGEPMPCTAREFQVSQGSGFYHWLNAIRGCQTGVYWRLTENVGWCGI